MKVIDEGCGIKESEMSKLFKLFSRVESSKNINTEGIGMGLNICKQIVNHCGGEISCQSDGKNKGSTFIFSMRMKTDQASQEFNIFPLANQPERD